MTENTLKSEPGLISRPYISLTRVPFDEKLVTIQLQDMRKFPVKWTELKSFLALHSVVIPPLALDAVYNFNEVHFYPQYPGYPDGKIDIQ